jgi:hypothetical protein
MLHSEVTDYKRTNTLKSDAFIVTSSFMINNTSYTPARTEVSNPAKATDDNKKRVAPSPPPVIVDAKKCNKMCQQHNGTTTRTPYLQNGTPVRLGCTINTCLSINLLNDSAADRISRPGGQNDYITTDYQMQHLHEQQRNRVRLLYYDIRSLLKRSVNIGCSSVNTTEANWYSNEDNEIDDNDDDVSVDSIELTKARIERRK